MKLKRFIGLVLGCDLLREVVVEVVFVNFLEFLYFILVRSYDLNALIGMV